MNVVAKVKEANYEWDAEKKELKKIEQKPADWLQELEDKLANATPQQLAEWKEKYFKEEPVEWSEEDRKMMRNIIDDIHCGTKFNPKVMHAANEREKWFKSICRPQDDGMMIKLIIIKEE